MKTFLAWVGGVMVFLWLLGALGILHFTLSVTAYPVECIKVYQPPKTKPVSPSRVPVV